MSEHTPGPWEWWTSNSFLRLSHERDGDVISAYVATDGHSDLLISKADMALISASPDLLEALESIAEYWNGDSNLNAMTNALNYIEETALAAIAKAKGES